jgi:hypothetical protein
MLKDISENILAIELEKQRMTQKLKAVDHYPS